MSGSATSAQPLRVILNAAEVGIQATGGIPHDGFWRQVDANRMPRQAITKHIGN